MVTKRFVMQTALLCVSTALILSACSGSSGTSPSVPMVQQPGASAQRAISPRQRERTQEDAAVPGSSSNSNCILIDTVYPKSDFAGRGFTAAAVSGGDHLNIDATGCTYGIYLFPGAKDLNIDHAVVRHASRIQIFAEAVPGVTIDHTIVNGTSPGTADPTSFSLGGIAFRGAGGTVRHTRIFNAESLGMNIVANSGCFVPAATPCLQSNVTVAQTVIDNSKSTGDGFDVIGGPLPQVTVASISHSTVIGPNTATLAGRSEVDIYGAQVGYALFDASVQADFDSAVNDQIGFDAYCSTGISSLTDLANLHDRISTGTTVTLPQTPLPENQVLNVFSADQLDAVFGPGSC